MALTDISEALTDPDYVDQLQYIRTEVVTAATGRGTVANQNTYTFYGSVQAGGGDQLNRAGDAEYNSGSIDIITKEPLTAGNEDFTADKVLWKGHIYTVASISPWTNYGEGFVKASCTLKPLRGAAS